MQKISEETSIGFIGTGVMGKSMASHLLEAGHPLYIYTRTKEKAADLLNKGAQWKDSVAELAAVSDVIITIVGYPHDVEEVYLGEDGIIAHAEQGTILIDMTTSSPLLAEEIAEKAQDNGLVCLDAPVSGGDLGAKNGTLTIMVGGGEYAFQAVMPIFKLMGENIVLQGGAGAGQHTKMSNQITIASTMLGACEALAYAEKAGLDTEKVLSSISTGAAGSWTLKNLVPRMISGDLEPGFYIKHFIKDMKIALQSAEELGLYTPGLKLALSLYEKLAEEDMENKGTQALIEFYRNSNSEHTNL